MSKKLPVVLDLETKYTFREFPDHKNLGVSVVAVYDYAEGRSHAFIEKDISKLFPILERSSYIVGFNVQSFDLPVLGTYYPGSIAHFETFDILEDIRSKLGRRLALNDLLNATLGKRKSGHGLMAIDYYKEGKIEELIRYCIDDVMLTKDIFDYGVKFGEVFYLNERGKNQIKVDWKKYLEDAGKKETPLTLPF
mgnify:CR=1 FL=1